MKVNISKNNTPAFNGIYNSKTLKKGLEFAANNSSLFAATTSLVFSTVARPIAILSTPNTNIENKQYACAKSFASSAAGYLMMVCASLPVAKAVKNIDKNPHEYLREKTINSLRQSGKTLQGSKKYQFATQLFKLGLGFIMAVPKSVLTCALIPPIMSSVFKKNNEQVESNQKNKNVTFGNTYDAGTKKLSKVFGKIMDLPAVLKMSEKFHNTNFEQHIISLTDILLTGTFIHQTKNNKKIDENRKKTLMYNAGISTGLCLTGGYALNHVLKKSAEKFIDKFSKINKNDAKLDKYIEGIKIAKPILILGGIYYILIPLLSTFFAERVDKD